MADLLRSEADTDDFEVYATTQLVQIDAESLRARQIGQPGLLAEAAESPSGDYLLVERLQRLVEGIDSPIAAFARDGMFVGASDAARPLLGFRNLSEAGLDEARRDAPKRGRVETPVGIGDKARQRGGSGADNGAEIGRAAV